MSMVPRLADLNEIASQISMGLPEGALSPLLSRVAAATGAQFARWYTVRDGQVTLAATTEDSDDQRATPPAIPDQPIYQPETGSWLAPLGAADRIAALLEIGLETPEAEMSAWLALLATTLSLALRAASNNENTQVATASAILRADTPLDILIALDSFLGNVYDSSFLGSLEGPDGALSPLAELRDGEVVFSEHQRRLDDFPSVERLRDGKVVSIGDVAADPALSATTRRQLQEQGIVALVVAPLMAGAALSGILAFMHPAPLMLEREQLDALEALAEQVVVVLQNQSLVTDMAIHLGETQALYDVNQALLEATTPEDILRLLKRELSLDASTLIRVSPAYDENGDLAGYEFSDELLSSSHEPVFGLPAYASLSGEEIAALGSYWRTMEEAVILVENIDTQASDFPLTEHLRQQGVQAYIHLPLMRDERLYNLIAVAFRRPQNFGEQAHNLYRTLSKQIAIVLQNQQLLHDAESGAQQLTERVALLQTLRELATLISASQDEPAFLQRSAEVLVEALAIDHAGILMLNPDGASGTVIAEHPAQGTVGRQFDLKDNLLYERLQQPGPEPIVVNDVHDDPRINDADRENFESLGIHALLLLPLAMPNKLLGSVGLDIYSAERSFTPQMIDTAQAIVGEMALGLQNMRLLRDSQRYADQLQHIAAFNRSVQATLDLASILEIAITESDKMLPQDRMSITLYDPGEGVLRVVARHIAGETTIDLNSKAVGRTDGSMLGHVWATKSFLHIADQHTDPQFPDPESPFRSYLLMPLQVRERTLGTINIGAIQAYAYSASDQAVFRQMADQLAVAIENSMAFQQSQRFAQNKLLVSDISAKLQTQRDIQRMLEITMGELGNALRARRARIRLGPQPTDE